jgi:hypothetical protein
MTSGVATPATGLFGATRVNSIALIARPISSQIIRHVDGRHRQGIMTAVGKAQTQVDKIHCSVVSACLSALARSAEMMAVAVHAEPAKRATHATTVFANACQSARTKSAGMMAAVEHAPLGARKVRFALIGIAVHQTAKISSAGTMGVVAHAEHALRTRHA